MIPPVQACAPLARRCHRHHAAQPEDGHAKGVPLARRMAHAVQDLHEQGSPAFEAASR
jgi:hypothetical protein